MVRTVAILGAGASGCLSAVHLLRSARSAGVRLDIELWDPCERLGRGVAFGTTDPAHLLNVPAGGMSAFPDDPGHFVRWLGGRASAEEFVPRMWFGDYVAAVLADEVAASPDSSVTHRRALASSLPEADAVVLACGLPGTGCEWATPELLAAPRFVANPWDPAALADCLSDPDPVTVVGSGLTAIDVVLSLVGANPDRSVTVVSRSGRWPRRHAPHGPAVVPEVADWGASLAELREHVREHLRTAPRGDWRAAVGGLRTVTTELWQRLSEDDRLRFLQEHAGEWNRLRHRVPRATAQRLADLRAAGQLRMVRELPADTSSWVVNCTGPANDVRRLGDPLVDDLFASGRAVPATAGMGVRTEAGRLISATGELTSIWALGAWRRGELWESTAIPEIRTQAADLGRAMVSHLSAPDLDSALLDR